jgi:diaminopimelate epimerase
MTDPTRIRLDLPVNGYPRSSIAHAVFTGTDHVVIPSDNLDAERVEEDGRTLRHHEAFQPSGTNVNFFQRLAASSLAARTYERGVEAETLSCGTGAVACAVVHALLDNAPSPVQVLTRSGETLTVHFKREDDRFREVCLEGSAHFVFDGEWIEPAGAERHDP